MKTYRIYTETLNQDREVIEIVTSLFSSFTIFHATGYWNGKPESSTVVEIVVDSDDSLYGDTASIEVKKIAEEIRIKNHQQSVLVTESEVESYLLTD